MIEGLYIHIPFCRQKCPYCDFVSLTRWNITFHQYLDLLLRELELRFTENWRVKTIYFGGGTPSLLDSKTLASFVSKLVQRVGDVREITVECNPEDYTERDWGLLLSAGVNRISIGAQSFLPKGLKILGRDHSVYHSIRSVLTAYKAGFRNINVDIIYAYPGQTLEDLEEELKVVRDLPIAHLSAYMLTPYEDTLFGIMVKKGQLEMPSDERVADMFLLLSEALEELGFVHYEVSNFAKKGYQCMHNLLYWTHGEFVGLGVSAWSFVENKRMGNTRNLELYRDALMEKKLPVETVEELKGKELLFDRLFVGLRTAYGVEEELLPLIPSHIREFFVVEEGRLRLTKKGWLLMNSILLELYDAVFNGPVGGGTLRGAPLQNR
ncbi:oxygen-independent coproporphyrinogen III oxidase [Thermocrinis albus DSM 14484]|uniref:Heme chaperone HemW n=1 Tax=Thermocrinis albus (strain DSM 14484 / JCM 11386 / HI 11/12) TaxID=638303 RepID=D3SPM9_THEAH|nr:radical SAM family heme chaperone HemW [Thermocrinis albus]ADC89116.1 oxygen-independent coproporphyrinogen III oxidase [Thermocrinis albus DSM 14484]